VSVAGVGEIGPDLFTRISNIIAGLGFDAITGAIPPWDNTMTYLDGTEDIFLAIMNLEDAMVLEVGNLLGILYDYNDLVLGLIPEFGGLPNYVSHNALVNAETFFASLNRLDYGLRHATPGVLGWNKEASTGLLALLRRVRLMTYHLKSRRPIHGHLASKHGRHQDPTTESRWCRGSSELVGELSRWRSSTQMPKCDCQLHRRPACSPAGRHPSMIGATSPVRSGPTWCLRSAAPP
jgi:hypothetical protein